MSEKHWDEIKERVRGTHPMSARLNKLIDNKRLDIDTKIREYQGRMTIDVLREIVQGTYNPNKEQDTDFVQLAIDTMQTQYKLGKVGISVYDNALCNLRQFRRFLKETTGNNFIRIGDMNVDVLSDFITWKKESRGNKEETINKALTPLMKAARTAARRGWMNPTEADEISNAYLIPKGDMEEENEERDVHYLTKEQLVEFTEHYAREKHPRTLDYMEMFLFAFHACGLRFSDVLTLRWTDIDFESKHLSKILVKGTKRKRTR